MSHIRLALKWMWISDDGCRHPFQGQTDVKEDLRLLQRCITAPRPDHRTTNNDTVTYHRTVAPLRGKLEVLKRRGESENGKQIWGWAVFDVLDDMCCCRVKTLTVTKLELLCDFVGKHTGAQERDIVTCCFTDMLNDERPKPFNLKDLYQIFKIHSHQSGGFFGRSITPDGIPPSFLRKKGWRMEISGSYRSCRLSEALGVDASLREQLPDFNFPISRKRSAPVTVGKWYCPFIFVRDGTRMRQQIKKSMYCSMTLEQRWEEVYSCGSEESERGDGVVAVNVSVEREMVMVSGIKATRNGSSHYWKCVDYRRYITDGLQSFGNDHLSKAFPTFKFLNWVFVPIYLEFPQFPSLCHRLQLPFPFLDHCARSVTLLCGCGGWSFVPIVSVFVKGGSWVTIVSGAIVGFCLGCALQKLLSSRAIEVEVCVVDKKNKYNTFFPASYRRLYRGPKALGNYRRAQAFVSDKAVGGPSVMGLYRGLLALSEGLWPSVMPFITVDADGFFWFRAYDPYNRRKANVGLSSAIVEPMRWVEEGGGWAHDHGREKMVRVREEARNQTEWLRFACYVLVESFCLRTLEGKLVLRYDFRHIHNVRCKWE
ncbi:hypothetical protein V8G54_013007 [Vigna mungo]|uniref:Uncharacterized protein n=1 Tax=Vigna mungo TaxID=3915 RepID=A0AAQ3NUV0_VIGMU